MVKTIRYCKFFNKLRLEFIRFINIIYKINNNQSFFMFFFSNLVIYKVLFIIIFYNNINLFILYKFSFVYRSTTFQIFCNSFSIIIKSIALTFLYCLSFFILYLTLNLFNYLIKNLSIFWFIYYSNFCHNIITNFFCILLMIVAFFYSIFYCYSNNASFKFVHQT